MYNEDEREFKETMTGVMENYIKMRLDKEVVGLKKRDFLVFVICDGFQGIPESFKKYATDLGFYDETILEEQGFMCKDREGNKKMRDIRDIVAPGVKAPMNIIHMF